MPIPSEVRADFDRLRNLIDEANSLSEDVSSDARSMAYEYLCVAITGKLEQNIKQILIAYADSRCSAPMGAVVSKLCQSFQNPDKAKIITLLDIFDKDFSKALEAEWNKERSVGNTISDMVGLRKTIAHQTSNSRNSTKTKIESFYLAYRTFITDLSNHFLK